MDLKHPRQLLQNLFENRSAQKAALGFIGLVLFIFLIQAFGKAYREDGYDLTSYLLSAEALGHGENPYETGSPFQYMYPMTLAFILIPLAWSPYWLANLLWFSFNVFSLIYSVKLLVDSTKTRESIDSIESIKSSGKKALARWGRILCVPLALLFLVFLGIIQNNLLNGQVNFPVLLLSVLFLKYFSQKKFWVASLFLSLAISIKVVPLIFIAFALLRKNVRVPLYTTLLCLILFSVPMLTLGPEIWDIYRHYFETFIFHNLGSSPASPGTAMYFTLEGFLSRHLFAWGSWNHSSLASIIMVMASIYLVDFFVLKRRKPENEASAFSLYALGILLISPISETHHLAFMIPGLVLTTTKIAFGTQGLKKAAAILLLLFLGCFFLGGVFHHGPFYFLAILILFVLTAIPKSQLD